MIFIFKMFNFFFFNYWSNNSLVEFFANKFPHIFPICKFSLYICNDFDFNNLKNSYPASRAQYKSFPRFRRWRRRKPYRVISVFYGKLVNHYLKTGRRGQLRPPSDTYTYASRDYKSYELKKWPPPPLTEQMFIFQLTQFPRSRWPTFSRNVTG